MTLDVRVFVQSTSLYARADWPLCGRTHARGAEPLKAASIIPAGSGQGRVSYTCTVPVPGLRCSAEPSLPSTECFLVTLDPQKISHISLFKEERLQI